MTKYSAEAQALAEAWASIQMPINSIAENHLKMTHIIKKCQLTIETAEGWIKNQTSKESQICIAAVREIRRHIMGLNNETN